MKKLNLKNQNLIVLILTAGIITIILLYIFQILAFEFKEFTDFIVNNSVFIITFFLLLFCMTIYFIIVVIKKTRELTEANEKLKELDRLKSMFLASMSHELRTPLTSIIGFTRMMLKGLVGDLNEEQKKQLTIILNSADHLHQLINDIIDISKIEADKLDISIGKFDIVGELTKILESFSVAREKKKLKIITVLPKNLEIYSDRKRVNQILVNLIGNAIKFTDEGSISINIQSSNDTVKISVKDTGLGIKKEDLTKLFQAFSRIIEPGKFKEGTGLGLYLSRKLAKLLGGDILLTSEFGKGSTFTLVLKSIIKESFT